MFNFKSRLKVGDNQLLKNGLALQSQNSKREYTYDDFSMELWWIFVRLFNTNDIAQTSLHTEKEINAEPFIQKILTHGWNVIKNRKYHVIEERKTKPAGYILAHPKGFLLEINLSHRSQAQNSKKRDYLRYSIPQGEICFFESIQVLYANDGAYSTPDTHDDVIKTLADTMLAHCLDADESASIGIISAMSGEYYIKNFSLEGKTPSFNYPDLHYGEGFENFHASLLNKLKYKTKGLVLLHGEPGTGKTQYIRILLKELAKVNKSILYAPPSLSASLTEPAIIEFISDWVIKEERDCILLIEDAEPLLEVRNEFDGRSAGISNLLNMTDGLLNDILGLTVIATFNTQLSKIDPALLRPQRLLARKEFNKMSKETFCKLAEKLDIELPDISYPATLAEFYSADAENAILIHTIKEEKQIGFKKN